MNTKVRINRLATGVPGLDEVLDGGLPAYSFNLIAGAPGSGKTMLAPQMMFAPATPHNRALYFTVLGEPPLKMLRYQQQFDDFDPARLDDAIRYVNLADDALSGDLDKVLARIVAEVEADSPALVFVDAFRSVAVAAAAQGRTPLPLQVRGQRTLPGLHTFRIGRQGLTVIPPAAQRTADMPAQQGRLSTGVPGLDEMLGGGLPRGYSLLVAGPSGSGKTVLATAFLAEGCRQGEPGVVAVFEQRPDHLRNALMKELVAYGQVTLVDSGIELGDAPSVDGGLLTGQPRPQRHEPE